MFGLTGRILFSFWLTLIIFVLSLIAFFVSEQGNDHNHHRLPSAEISESLTLKLLSEPYKNVQEWFRKQPKKDIKRLFVIYKDKEILNRTLPIPLTNINKDLSVTSPFIHQKHHGFIFVGRQILLPSSQTVNILSKGHYIKTPLHNIIKDQWLGFLISAFLISGVISYLLALYIMKPISHFRKATQKLASGDLSIRVQDDIKGDRGEISLLAQDFDNMADKLDRTMSSHKHLIQDISHELRSPVARLQLALELAKKRLNISDGQTDIARIEKECDQLNTIINTLLNLPAYELDPSLGFKNKVNLPELLKNICQDLNFSNPERKITLNISTASCPDIQANAQLLRSAIENILKNAQYYHQGEQTIEVKLLFNQSDIIIQCCDQGPGVSEENLAEIFKPFYRISEARERSSGAHGLGLAISKRAIELHGGEIQAYNQEPQGLCVEVVLPLNISA